MSQDEVEGGSKVGPVKQPNIVFGGNDGATAQKRTQPKLQKNATRHEHSPGANSSNDISPRRKGESTTVRRRT